MNISRTALYDISIVIPTLNEEKTIEEVVINSRTHGDVLVINDGSSDNTSTLAKKDIKRMVEEARKCAQVHFLY